MVAIPLPTETSPGRTHAEDGGRLFNAYAEPLGSGASAPAVLRRVPGLRRFANVGFENFRGGLTVAPYTYAAFNGAIVKVDLTGAVIVVDAFAGTGPVIFARNNKRPLPDVVAVSNTGAYEVKDNFVIALTDPDLPQPNSVASVGGYFVMGISDGRMFASGLNATTFDPLDMATAESNPDGLIRVVGYSGKIYACGSASIEVWSNEGNPTGFPFSFSTIIQRGIIGAQAITGFEDGFSKGLLLVGEDCQVYALSGYQLTKISRPYLDWLIQTDPNRSDIRCWCHSISGHPCLVVQGTNWSWTYDLTTGKWHERRSHLSSTWRAQRSVFASGRWLVGDSKSEWLLELTEAVHDEVGEPLRFEVETAQAGDFPARIRVLRADFDLATGVGLVNGIDPNQTDPKLEISWTDDGGYTWSTPLLCQLGQMARWGQRVFRSRLGLTGARGRRWRIASSEPVYLALVAGDMTLAKVD